MSVARSLQIRRLVEGATTRSHAAAPPDTPAPTPLRAPATEGEATAILATLTRALEHLPAHERLVLTLCYYEELTPQEIGDVLQLPEDHIRQLQATAIAHVRQALATEGRQ